MDVGDGLSAKALIARILSDVEAGTGEFAGYVVTKEKMDPKLLRSARASIDDARASLGLPRMFEGLLDQIEDTRVSGATPEQTLELIVDKLRTTTTRWEIREEIPPLRQVLGDLEVPAAMESLRRDTLDQLQRNLDRLEGRLDDGFRDYPDYAELGRALASSELLLNVHRAGGVDVGTAAAKAGNVITW